MTYNKDFRPRLKGNKLAAFNNITQKERRILIVGDIHAPFSLNGYLDFCKETYAIYNCNQVIFILHFTLQTQTEWAVETSLT